MTYRVYWFLQEYEGGYVKFGLLRSVEWLYNLGIANVGDKATFQMEEFGVVGDAQLMQVDRCPEIVMGQGRICTGWFEHSGGKLWELWIEGSDTPLRGTDRHPIWSNDRLTWIPLADLQDGESVQAHGNFAKVLNVVETEQEEPVYTIEVDGDHCYRIGQQGLMVHNASAHPPGSPEHREERWCWYQNRIAVEMPADPLNRTNWDRKYDTAIQNAVRGNEFESALRAFLGVTRGGEFTLPSGQVVRPDLMVPVTGWGRIEVKDRLEVNFEDNLRGIVEGCELAGIPLYVVISARTQVVSVPTQAAVINRTGGGFYIWNPNDGAFRQARFNGNRVV